MITYYGIPGSILAAALRSTRVASFDGGKWKVDANGKLEVDAAGNPIWINTAGQEQTVAGDTITRLNGEAKTHRERAEAAEGKVKAYVDAGLTDPTDVRKTLDKYKDVDLSKLVDAGKLDEVKAQVASVMQAQVDAEKTRGDGLKGKLDNILLSQAFASSKWAKDNLTIPADLAQASFGQRFKVDENDKVIFVGVDGKPAMSAKRAGEMADFDEGLESVVGAYANKGAILKGNNNTGSGNGGNGGNTGGGKRTMARAEFDKTPADQRGPLVADMRAGNLAITD